MTFPERKNLKAKIEADKVRGCKEIDLARISVQNYGLRRIYG